MSYTILARETKKNIHETIRQSILTEEDMVAINKIIVNRIEKILENDKQDKN